MTNQQQIAEKNDAVRKRREEYEQNVKNGYQDREMLQQMDAFEKQRNQEQRKDYMESLKSQMNARNQSMHFGNQLTNAERLVNFRRQVIEILLFEREYHNLFIGWLFKK